jgi:hypothetical protein
LPNGEERIFLPVLLILSQLIDTVYQTIKTIDLLNGLERCKVFLKFGDDHKCRSRTSVKTSPGGNI